MFIIGFLIENASSVAAGILVGFTTLSIIAIARIFRSRKDYPPGPAPLNFFGIIKSLLWPDKKRHMIFSLWDEEKKYGKIFTTWFGATPQIIITDPKITVEVLNKHVFAGRPQSSTPDLFKEDPNDKSVGIVSSDFNPEWEVLRKVTHSALRKYAVSEKLPVLVSEVIDDVVTEIQEKEGDKAFDITHYLYLTMYSILSSSAFGKRYRFDEPELLDWIESIDFQSLASLKFAFLIMFPKLRFIPPFRATYKKFMDNIAVQSDISKRHYEEHVKTFDGHNIRDFTDAMLFAKKEAEDEEKESQKYLYPKNLMNAVLLLFVAGSETTRMTLLWIFLMVANEQEYQQKMRDEIEEVIGSEDIATIEHKSNCPLTTAFIAEVMRFRPFIPSNVPHKAMRDTEIGGFKVKEGTAIGTFLYHCLHDKETWGDPEVFRPERFIDAEGKFVSKPCPFYIPFSYGRRSCPGNTLALTDMFYILVRFLQKTKGMTIELENGPGSIDLMPDPAKPVGFVPHDFKMKLVEKPVKV